MNRGIVRVRRPSRRAKIQKRDSNRLSQRFPKSARKAYLSILSGGPGMTWSASFDETGKGFLRVSAIDASKLALMNSAPQTIAKPEPVSNASQSGTQVAAPSVATISAPPAKSKEAASQAPTASDSDQQACRQILTFCKAAGFALGAADAGNGLYADCITPILTGRPQPNAAVNRSRWLMPKLFPLAVRFGVKTTKISSEKLRRVRKTLVEKNQRHPRCQRWRQRNLSLLILAL